MPPGIIIYNILLIFHYAAFSGMYPKGTRGVNTPRSARRALDKQYTILPVVPLGNIVLYHIVLLLILYHVPEGARGVNTPRVPEGYLIINNKYSINLAVRQLQYLPRSGFIIMK